jgi:hypothetical protein
MTLKEKFKQWLDTDPRLQIREVQLEVIAEEFAIEFAEWLEDSIYKENNFIKMDVVKRIKYTTKELLEIYKKEKGL